VPALQGTLLLFTGSLTPFAGALSLLTGVLSVLTEIASSPMGHQCRTPMSWQVAPGSSRSVWGWWVHNEDQEWLVAIVEMIDISVHDIFLPLPALPLNKNLRDFTVTVFHSRSYTTE